MDEKLEKGERWQQPSKYDFGPVRRVLAVIASVGIVVGAVYIFMSRAESERIRTLDRAKAAVTKHQRP